jgi:hypothetical protein
MLVQILSSCSIRLDLHANWIMLRRKWTRERVAAKKRGDAGGFQAHDDVLTGQSDGKLATASALQGNEKTSADSRSIEVTTSD